MQVPAAASCRALVLVLIMSTITISVVEGDQHDQVCIPPGSNGEYSVSYNLDSLPVKEPSEVQDLVLKSVSTQFGNLFTEGPGELCTGKNAYSAVARSNIDLFGYAYCGQGGVDRQGCSDCLKGGAEIIEQNCANSCYGAQASSDKCCIRFEGVEFCLGA